MYDPYAEFTKHVLRNGLEVHSVFWDRPWIAVEIVVHSGGREDPIEMPGLAHFVEHLVSQNIPNRRFDSVENFFENCGGRAGFGSTSYLSTRYNFTVPANLATFHKALAIFGSMLFGARLERYIERERDVVLGEFNERYPFPQKLEWNMGVYKSLFRGHRLETWSRPLGRPEGFLSATKDNLQDFYDLHYVPANISLVIIGGLKTEELIAGLENSPFGINKNGKRNRIHMPSGLPAPPTERSKIVRLSDYSKFQIKQTEYKASWAFPSDFPHQALRVFDQMLEKILFREIRENLRLTYGIRTDYVNFQDVYQYRIGGSINPDATRQIDELVRKCINMVPLERRLFEQKLRSLKQNCFMIDLTGKGLAGNSAGDLVSDHRIIPMQEVWDELHKVTFEQMAEATAFLSSNRQYTFIACP